MKTKFTLSHIPNSIFLLLLIVTLVGCQEKGYQLRGISKANSIEGQTIYLKDMEQIPIDSAIIENSKFEFSGTILQPSVTYISVLNDWNEEYIRPFLLENTILSVQIDEEGNISVSGSQPNNEFTFYRNQQKELGQASMDYYNKVKAENPQQSQYLQDSVQRELTRFNTRKLTLDKKYILHNANTPLGQYVWKNRYKTFTAEEQQEIQNRLKEK